MTSLRKPPWLSLGLLLITYSTLGWLLSAYSNSWWPWAITVVGVLLLAKAMSSPWAIVRDGFVQLFKSDSRTFLVAVVIALLTVVIITWLHIFTHALVVISSGILVRLDTQSAGLSEPQVFVLMLVGALLGIGLGALVHIFMGVEV